MSQKPSYVGARSRRRWPQLTAGEKEVRAWTIQIGDSAPKAVGVIHSDFERGFIKLGTVAYKDLVECGAITVAREKFGGWGIRTPVP